MFSWREVVSDWPNKVVLATSCSLVFFYLLKKTLSQNFPAIRLVLGLYNTVRKQLSLKGTSQFSPTPQLSPFSLYNTRDGIHHLPPGFSPTLFRFSLTLRWFHPHWVPLGEVHAQVICQYPTVVGSCVPCSFSASVSCSYPFVTFINISCHTMCQLFTGVSKYLTAWTQHLLLLTLLPCWEWTSAFLFFSSQWDLTWSALLTLRLLDPGPARLSLGTAIFLWREQWGSPWHLSLASPS